jgi:sulfatase modifying factor 1
LAFMDCGRPNPQSLAFMDCGCPNPQSLAFMDCGRPNPQSLAFMDCGRPNPQSLASSAMRKPRALRAGQCPLHHTEGAWRRWVVVFAAALGGCVDRSGADQTERTSSSSSANVPDAAVRAGATPLLQPLAQQANGVELPLRERCPADMLPVEGSYCSKLQQTCARELGSHRGHPTRSERCLEYLAPSVCEGPRSELRFCIDRFEWPNREGSKPLVLVSWQEAGQLCAAAGKRLCKEEEWTLACEGQQMLPYVLGYERPVGACAIDLAYREPKRALLPHADCLRDPGCAGELERLDQRRPSLAESSCKSPFGVIDMNGNVNEWVMATAARYPHRGALKGGWWGPVRNRCRPAVLQHREDHWGYEIGFRCCRNEDDTRASVP